MQNESGPIPPEAYGDYRVIGGYKQVLQPLAAGIPLVLNSPVEHRLPQEEPRRGAGRQSTYKARTMVLAVPGGVLKNGDITFNPPLPAARQAAMQEIVYLPVFKGILEFDPVLAATRCRPPDWDVLVGFDKNPATIWNASEGTPGYTGQLIVTWMTGGKARSCSIWPNRSVTPPGSRRCAPRRRPGSRVRQRVHL